MSGTHVPEVLRAVQILPRMYAGVGEDVVAEDSESPSGIFPIRCWDSAVIHRRRRRAGGYPGLRIPIHIDSTVPAPRTRTDLRSNPFPAWKKIFAGVWCNFHVLLMSLVEMRMHSQNANTNANFFQDRIDHNSSRILAGSRFPLFWGSAVISCALNNHHTASDDLQTSVYIIQLIFSEPTRPRFKHNKTVCIYAFVYILIGFEEEDPGDVSFLDTPTSSTTPIPAENAVSRTPAVTGRSADMYVITWCIHANFRHGVICFEPISLLALCKPAATGPLNQLQNYGMPTVEYYRIYADCNVTLIKWVCLNISLRYMRVYTVAYLGFKKWGQIFAGH